jgi:hypothetical protein
LPKPTLEIERAQDCDEPPFPPGANIVNGSAKANRIDDTEFTADKIAVPVAQSGGLSFYDPDGSQTNRSLSPAVDNRRRDSAAHGASHQRASLAWPHELFARNAIQKFQKVSI